MDSERLCDHIAGRIKLYRKQKNMTAKELAAMIHKSTSAVSKYENGEIAIDIVTLFEIADALDVSVGQLTDVPDERPEILPSSALARSYFSKGSMFFAYYINGKNRELNKCIIEIHPADMSVVFYDKLKDYTNKYDCRHLYSGEISASDTHVTMMMQNQTNLTETLYVVVLNPFDRQDKAYGIISGISSRNMMPISYKILVSRNPLRETEELRESLIFTKKELRDIKLYNNFSINLRGE